jgi:hypothetical protein
MHRKDTLFGNSFSIASCISLVPVRGERCSQSAGDKFGDFRCTAERLKPEIAFRNDVGRCTFNNSKSSMAGVPASFITSVSSGTRHSIAHTVPHGATLTFEVPNNTDDVLPPFLALIPFNGHTPPRVVHLRTDRPE